MFLYENLKELDENESKEFASDSISPAEYVILNAGK